MAEEDPGLSLVDYVVALFILMVPMAIGIGFAVKDANKATRAEYLLGGRQMSVLPVASSLFVTFMSAVALIGVPMETYFYGLNQAMLPTGHMLSFVIGYLTVVPLMYPLGITSIFEYLKLRYNSESVRIMSTVLSLMSTVCYMAICLLSPALALEVSIGVPLWTSIIILGIMGTIYTAIGGIKSVIWTDAFQMLVLYIGLFVIIIKGCISVGGVGKIFKLAYEGGRLNYDKFSLDPRVRHTVWSLTIGSMAGKLHFTFNQATLQRVCCMKSLRDARRMYLVNIPMVLIFVPILAFVGIISYSYYKSLQCDPFEAGEIFNKNQIMPYFVLHAMQDIPGITGLFVSVLCCGSLSTLSSGINSLAANTVEDILRRPLKSLREATITSVIKVVALLYGFLVVSLAYMATHLAGPVQQMAATATGAISSPITGVFLLGGAVPWANKYGAMTGLLTSLLYNLWISFGARLQGMVLNPLPLAGTEGCADLIGNNINHNHTSIELQPNITRSSFGGPKLQAGMRTNERNFFYDITYEWYSFMGIFVCVSVGLIVSHMTNRMTKDCSQDWRYDGRYIFPLLRRVWGIKEGAEKKDQSLVSDVAPAAPEEKLELVTNGTK